MTRAQAKRQWDTANAQWFALCEALGLPPDSRSDDRMHEALQAKLNAIKSKRLLAKREYPDISGGITIATMRL